MNLSEIEISIGVQISAGIYFTVEREEWQSMTEDQQKTLINERLDSACNQMANNATWFGEARLSGQIIGPTPDTLTLDMIEVYDPEIDA